MPLRLLPFAAIALVGCALLLSTGYGPVTPAALRGCHPIVGVGAGCGVPW